MLIHRSVCLQGWLMFKGAKYKIDSPLVVTVLYQLYTKTNLRVSHTSRFPQICSGEARASLAVSVSSAVPYIYSKMSNCPFLCDMVVRISITTQKHNIYVIIEHFMMSAEALVCASCSQACSLLLRQQERTEPRL